MDGIKQKSEKKSEIWTAILVWIFYPTFCSRLCLHFVCGLEMSSVLMEPHPPCLALSWIESWEARQQGWAPWAELNCSRLWPDGTVAEARNSQSWSLAWERIQKLNMEQARPKPLEGPLIRTALYLVLQLSVLFIKSRIFKLEISKMLVSNCVWNSLLNLQTRTQMVVICIRRWCWSST